MSNDNLIYQDGQDVRVGDRIIYDGHPATVVAVISSKQFSKDFPEDEWGYFSTGFLIKPAHGQLVHMQKPDEDVELVDRSI